MSNYIIYTTDNDVLNFTNDLRVFIGGNDISINNWNKIYKNLSNGNCTKIINTSLPANEKINYSKYIYKLSILNNKSYNINKLIIYN